SWVLANLGQDTEALGFVAGFTGDEIENRLNKQGVKSSFVRLPEGMSRINVKLKAEVETEMNGKGPNITREDVEKLYRQVEGFEDGDYLVLSGSVPSGVDEHIYENLIEHAMAHKVNVVVDGRKNLLKNCLPFHPFMIKPNSLELGEMFDTTCSTYEEIVALAHQAQKLGARNVVVSMAADGAIFVGENGEDFWVHPPKGTLVNSIGAGDSLVAGFIAGYITTGDYHFAMKQGVASGSASAFSTELATKEEVEELMKQM
ncbi:MAG: 1-phosphofructokinase family hexose kinase, partial [Erysipelotrichaceae bacterium]|nr:1-phosphofructokinase family hexose kinase [Erysipelotrichaceae bacterium]